MNDERSRSISRRLLLLKLARRSLIACLTLALCTAVAANLYQQFSGGDVAARFDGKTFVVQAVMSGDRLALQSIESGDTRIVGLAGVDAPDLVPAATTQPVGALEAYTRLRDRVQGQRVVLSVPPLVDRTGGDARVYLFLEDDPGVSINEEMVALGLAFADRRTDHPYRKQFEQAESTARHKKLGFWSTMTDGDQPAWRQAWLTRVASQRPSPGE